MTPTIHFVQFFNATDHLVESVAAFTRDGILEDATCIVVATAEHRKAIEATLAHEGLDLRALSAQYKYIALDAHRLLSTFMVEGEPDQHQFHFNVGLLMRQAAARGRPLRIFGEMVAVLVDMGRMDAAVMLEELWNELSRQEDFTLFCGYSAAAFHGDHRSRARVGALHNHVISTSSSF